MRHGIRLVIVTVLAGALSVFAPSARAACTMPSGSYAGVKAGSDYLNVAGVAGFTSQPVYSVSSMTITQFPTIATPGKVTEHGKYSTVHQSGAPPNHLSAVIIASSGTMKLSGYDPNTCSGILTTSGIFTATPINCTAINSCSTGTPTAAKVPGTGTLKFTSSHGGAHVTLAPIGIDPIAPGSYYDLWRQ